VRSELFKALRVGQACPGGPHPARRPPTGPVPDLPRVRRVPSRPDATVLSRCGGRSRTAPGSPCPACRNAPSFAAVAFNGAFQGLCGTCPGLQIREAQEHAGVLPIFWRGLLRPHRTGSLKRAVRPDRSDLLGRFLHPSRWPGGLQPESGTGPVLSRRLGKAIDPGLVRIRDTRPQAPVRPVRQENIRGAFKGTIVQGVGRVGFSPTSHDHRGHGGSRSRPAEAERCGGRVVLAR
jgi:hypothetical protein